MLNDYLKKLPDIEGNVAVSFSGGLDSTTLVHLLVYKYGKDKVKTLTFDYNQRNNKELEMVDKNITRLGIHNTKVNLNFLGDIVKPVSSLIADSELKPKTAEENAGNPQVDTYVPFRNLIFSSILASFAEAQKCDIISLGLNQVDIYGYWDTSLEFVNKLQEIFNLNRMHQIKIVTPFIESYKEDEIKLAMELSEKFGYDILEYTWSCYRNGENGKECGVCNTCTEKLKGYILAGMPDNKILAKFNITPEKLKELKEMYLD